MCKKSCCCKVCKVLVLVGAINWGLVGLFDFNLVSALVGSFPMIERIVYIAVGAAGVMGLVAMCGCCKKGSCESGSCATPPQAPQPPQGGGMPPM
ncbi:DUF378 domain-containing protein [Candidatus Peribacteria bacterium]|jgi:uncharacterized protein|nr:DUF378 domain-containing protein [Candidatus Peribacteria bacterium]MBT4020931.1 DUF378 domain-containing protein [Candidatus Peribacteria bacterium]MBT4240659.1 DUF378 domain-containing protein [Candidatus Peribacteria bacterium]MBT4474373.1 DUF378 domain-containing protein [Candidatus Peribacteria bacterium]